MIEIIAKIVLTSSLIGMGIIIFRKIPVLVGLAEIAKIPSRGDFRQRLKEKVKILNPFKSFSFDILFQKILSKIRVLTLKTENKTANWLQRLREKTQKKKLKNDNYWEEIKEATNNKKNKNMPE